MANVLTPTDVYALVNSAVKAMSNANITQEVFDTSSFVSVGEAMLNVGYENTLNALHTVFANTIIDVRPYEGKFKIIAKTPESYGYISRKISFFSTELEQSSDWNTDLSSGLKDGETFDHYKIKKVYPLEINFSGLKTRQFHYTTFRKQLKLAFSSEREFSKYYVGEAVRIATDLVKAEEAENRLSVINAMGACYNKKLGINLRTAFNNKYGTAYTSVELMTTYLKDFTAFFVTTLKNDMDLFTDDTNDYHLTPAKTDDSGNNLVLYRHTPKANQRLIMYKPIWRDSESMVYPEIFHDDYLKPEQYEGVMFWQNRNKTDGTFDKLSMQIAVKPNQLNETTGASETGTELALENNIYFLGFLFDDNALATTVKNEDIITTPVNAGYDGYNTYYHWGFNELFDMTENMRVYYLSDET